MTAEVLSTRERQIVELLVAGKLNKEIAHELDLTEGTIKEYMNRMFHKLTFRNRVELAVWYVRLEMAKGGKS